MVGAEGGCDGAPALQAGGRGRESHCEAWE